MNYLIEIYNIAWQIYMRRIIIYIIKSEQFRLK